MVTASNLYNKNPENSKIKKKVNSPALELILSDNLITFYGDIINPEPYPIKEIYPNIFY